MTQTVPPDWDPWSFIPERYNLGVDLTTRQVRQGRGEKWAVLWENADGARRALTYRELDAATNRLASSLRDLGLEKGDRVFLRLPNIPEFYISALAVAKLGGVFIPSSTQFRTGEVQYRLQDSGAKAVVTTSELFGPIEQASGQCPELSHLIVVPYPEGEAVSGEHHDFHRLVEAGAESFTPAETRNEEIAFIAYTSGTTGDPKGVVHRHRYPVAYESLIRFWHDYQSDDVVACPSELGWLLPVASTFLYALVHGLTVVLFDPRGGKFDPQQWFRLMETYRITNFTAPPTVYRMLMAEADRADQFDLSHWRHGVAAGEPLPADTLHGIERNFGFTPLDGLGMSECMVYCFNRIDLPVRPGSCGRPAPGTHIEVMDENRNPLPAGSEGTLCIRRDTHPGMMKEYWNKPEQTADVFEGDWYVSGDVVLCEEDGYFWFKGRADDVMKCSGYRISPFEVESCLLQHPAVLEAAAVESPDPVRGRVVKAYLILRPEATPSEQLAGEIQEFTKQHIAPYKHPRQIEFVATLPKTPSGKIKRRELREAAG